MAETIDEITMTFEDEEGVLLVKELEKVVLTKGAWATLMFKYQNLDKKTGEFGEPKYAIRRYQKVAGEYRSKSKFNISSIKQAKMIVDALNTWIEADSKEEE